MLPLITIFLSRGEMKSPISDIFDKVFAMMGHGLSISGCYQPVLYQSEKQIFCKIPFYINQPRFGLTSKLYKFLYKFLLFLVNGKNNRLQKLNSRYFQASGFN